MPGILVTAAVAQSPCGTSPCGAAPCGQPCQTYRLQYNTVYEEQQVTAYKIEVDTVYQERQVTSYRPVWETQTRDAATR